MRRPPYYAAGMCCVLEYLTDYFVDALLENYLLTEVHRLHFGQQTLQESGIKIRIGRAEFTGLRLRERHYIYKFTKKKLRTGKMCNSP